MSEPDLRKLLGAVRDGRLQVDAAYEQIKGEQRTGLGFSVVDLHRQKRLGFPEVIYCGSKTTEQVVAIAQAMYSHGDTVLCTRATLEMSTAIATAIQGAAWNPVARTISIAGATSIPRGTGTVAIVAAGTSDLPVAEEARVTAELFGNDVNLITDVGVAGLHRLVERLDEIRQARVLIVVAGMEGALPTVVGGLVGKPIIAVPTSVGYGASFGGIAALLGMLNSCAPGVSVVNIDNGFGAGYLAGLINHL